MPQSLPNTAPLTLECDLAAQMVAGIDRYLLRATADAAAHRQDHWRRDPSSPEAYEASVAPNRAWLARILGADAERVEPRAEWVTALRRGGTPGLVGEGRGYRIHELRWQALPGVDGEGLLLVPERPPVADVIALPDCEQTPAMLAGLHLGMPAEAQFARRLAESGCRVLVPQLVNRAAEFSGLPTRRSTVPHREFIYRAAFELGWHLLGFEVQKVLAAVDGFTAESNRPVAVYGYGEGGLLALAAAALDPRLAAAGVAGYFGPREELWREPIDRNVWSLLTQFGDAELASLVCPRPLVIEACEGPSWHGRDPSNTSAGPTPGDLTTPARADVEREVARARELTGGLGSVELAGSGDGLPGGDEALGLFLRQLGRAGGAALHLAPRGPMPRTIAAPDTTRLQRQVEQLIAYTQALLEDAEARRESYWSAADLSSAEAFAASARAYRARLWEDVIGKLPDPTLPLNARTRLRAEHTTYTEWDVLLDVYDDVVAYGILLLPRDIPHDERRPVVVVQHGLEGRAEDPAVPPATVPYRAFGVPLVERGFVVFSPQNPYLGYDSFRTLQRKANPLGLSLFSFIIRQHERILAWLGEQPFVDAERIGFYGISYGGKTAMRVPAVLEGYALSICSGDYNEWIRKCAQVRYPNNYLFTTEYEMFEFDLGNTFNHAEMSWLIFPRPFMVERGRFDGCGTDGWVGYEFAKSLRLYHLLGLPERCQIEWFNRGHEINGVGTHAFLHEWLDWPEPPVDLTI